MGRDKPLLEELLLPVVVRLGILKVGLRRVHCGRRVANRGVRGRDLRLIGAGGLIQVGLRAGDRGPLLLKLALNLHVGRDLRHLSLREPMLGLDQRPLRLSHLGLDLGRINARQHLPLGDTVSFVHLQVDDAARDVWRKADVERRINRADRVEGQDDVLYVRRSDGHNRRGVQLGRSLGGPAARRHVVFYQPEHNHPDQHRDDDQHHDPTLHEPYHLPPEEAPFFDRASI